MKKAKMSSARVNYGVSMSVTKEMLTEDKKTTRPGDGLANKPSLPSSLKENFDSYQKTSTIRRKDD